MHVWPRVAELAEHRAGHRLVEVGVVEDDERRVAAELERDLLHRPRALRHQQLPDLGRAGEADLADGRVRRSSPRRSAARRPASPVTTWKTPAGRPASARARATASAVSGVCSAGLRTIVQPAARAGAALRVGIAAGKFHGVIPAVRRRLLHDDDPPVGSGSGSCRRTPASPPRRTTPRTRRRRRSRWRLRERLALLGGEEPCEASSGVEHQVGQTAEDPGAVAREQCAPGRQRGCAALDRAARLGGAHPRHLAEQLAGGRVVDREGLARVRLELEQGQLYGRRHGGVLPAERFGDLGAGRDRADVRHRVRSAACCHSAFNVEVPSEATTAL